MKIKERLNSLSAKSLAKKKRKIESGFIKGILKYPELIIQPKSTVRLPITRDLRIVVPKR